MKILRGIYNENFKIYNPFFNFKASATGLIPVNADSMKPLGNNNQVYHERFFSDQEFDSFEDNHQKVILVKIGDTASLVSTLSGTGQPSQFATPPAGGRLIYVSK